MTIVETVPNLEYQIEVIPTSTADVGSYTVTMTIEMDDYPATPPVKVEFIVIVESGVNQAPYFIPSLSEFFPLSLERS